MALVTLKECRVTLGIETFSANDELTYASLTSGSSAYIDTICNRTFESGSMTTKSFIGFGSDEDSGLIHKSHTLRQVPISISPTPKLYSIDADGDRTAIDTDLYTFNATTGEIYFYSSNSYYFVAGTQYEVDYWGGYDGVTNIPYDVKMLCVEVVSLMKNALKYAGFTGETDGTIGRNFKFKLSLMGQSIVDKYTRD